MGAQAVSSTERGELLGTATYTYPVAPCPEPDGWTPPPVSESYMALSDNFVHNGITGSVTVFELEQLTRTVVLRECDPSTGRRVQIRQPDNTVIRVEEAYADKITVWCGAGLVCTWNGGDVKVEGNWSWSESTRSAVPDEVPYESPDQSEIGAAPLDRGRVGRISDHNAQRAHSFTEPAVPHCGGRFGDPNEVDYRARGYEGSPIDNNAPTTLDPTGVLDDVDYYYGQMALYYSPYPDSSVFSDTAPTRCVLSWDPEFICRGVAQARHARNSRRIVEGYAFPPASAWSGSDVKVGDVLRPVRPVLLHCRDLNDFTVTLNGRDCEYTTSIFEYSEESYQSLPRITAPRDSRAPVYVAPTPQQIERCAGDNNCIDALYVRAYNRHERAAEHWDAMWEAFHQEVDRLAQTGQPYWVCLHTEDWLKRVRGEDGYLLHLDTPDRCEIH